MKIKEFINHFNINLKDRNFEVVPNFYSNFKRRLLLFMTLQTNPKYMERIISSGSIKVLITQLLE